MAYNVISCRRDQAFTECYPSRTQLIKPKASVTNWKFGGAQDGEHKGQLLADSPEVSGRGGSAMKPTTTRAPEVTNTRIQVPAVVYDNPCLGEPVALHGELHLVLTTTSDHVGSHLNGSYAGTGLVTGVPYRASESKQDVWNVRDLPASHTTTMVTRLISRGAAENAFLYTTVTTTIDANGVPTVTVEDQRVECRG
jgi:hypothetical protein